MTKLAEASNFSQVEYNLTGIDGTTAGASTIFTVLPGSLIFYPSYVNIRLTNVAGVVSGDLSIALGNNNPSYNNFINGVGVPLTNVGDFSSGINSPFTIVPGAAGGTDFKINIVTPESTATTYTLAVTIVGNYL